MRGRKGRELVLHCGCLATGSDPMKQPTTAQHAFQAKERNPIVNRPGSLLRYRFNTRHPAHIENQKPSTLIMLAIPHPFSVDPQSRPSRPGNSTRRLGFGHRCGYIISISTTIAGDAVVVREGHVGGRSNSCSALSVVQETEDYLCTGFWFHTR